jgi:Zn-dependent protease with chaperone function
MSLDSANRSFLALVAISLLLCALLLCGAVGGVLAPLLRAYIARGYVPRGFASLAPPFGFALVIGTGLVRAGTSFARQTLASRSLSRRVRALTIAVPAGVVEEAGRAGLQARVVLVDASEPFSFVYGMLTPRVAVSRGLIRAVSTPELRAVLEHERYHVCNLDPLKIVLARTMSAGLFLLPALDYLRSRYAAARELAADRRAMSVCGRGPLAGALYKVVLGPPWSELGVAAPIGGAELMDARVAQLERGVVSAPAAVGVGSVALSILGATTCVAIFLASVQALGGQVAVRQVTGKGLVAETLLGGLICAIPYVAAMLVGYGLIARRARSDVCRRASDGRV